MNKVPQNIQTLFSAHALNSKSTAGHSEFDVVFEDDEDAFTNSQINKAKNNGEQKLFYY